MDTWTIFYARGAQLEEVIVLVTANPN